MVSNFCKTNIEKLHAKGALAAQVNYRSDICKWVCSQILTDVSWFPTKPHTHPTAVFCWFPLPLSFFNFFVHQALAGKKLRPHYLGMWRKHTRRPQCFAQLWFRYWNGTTFGRQAWRKSLRGMGKTNSTTTLCGGWTESYEQAGTVFTDGFLLKEWKDFRTITPRKKKAEKKSAQKKPNLEKE